MFTLYNILKYTIFDYFIVLVQSKSFNDSPCNFVVVILHGTRKMMTLQSVIIMLWNAKSMTSIIFIDVIGVSVEVDQCGIGMADRLYSSAAQRQLASHFNNYETVNDHYH